MWHKEYFEAAILNITADNLNPCVSYSIVCVVNYNYDCYTLSKHRVTSSHGVFLHCKNIDWDVRLVFCIYDVKIKVIMIKINICWYEIDFFTFRNRKRKHASLVK